MKVSIPLQLRVSLNSRGHWAPKAKRIALERSAVSLHLRKWRPEFDVRDTPLVVELTRLAPRELDDDNLVGRLKGVRDEVAKWLGLDDRDKRVSWRYAQAKPPKPREHWVTIEWWPR